MGASSTRPQGWEVGIPVGGHHRLCHAGWLAVPPEGLTAAASLGASGRGAADGAPAVLARSPVTELFVGSPGLLLSAPPLPLMGVFLCYNKRRQPHCQCPARACFSLKTPG